MPECLFCAIVAGQIPATVVGETGRVLAFRDIDPQAPTHVLVIPKTITPTWRRSPPPPTGCSTRSLPQAHQVATAEEIAERGYRIVFNTGAAAGQTVRHVHAHLLGGRALGWPPG